MLFFFLSFSHEIFIFIKPTAKYNKRANLGVLLTFGCHVKTPNVKSDYTSFSSTKFVLNESSAPSPSAVPRNTQIPQTTQLLFPLQKQRQRDREGETKRGRNLYYDAPRTPPAVPAQPGEEGNERETEESIQGGTRVVEKSDLPNQRTWTW